MTSHTSKPVVVHTSSSQDNSNDRSGGRGGLRGMGMEEQEKALVPRKQQKPKGGGEPTDDRALARHILSALAGKDEEGEDKTIDSSAVDPLAALIAKHGIALVRQESVGIKTTPAGQQATNGARLVAIIGHWCLGGSEADVLTAAAYAPGGDGQFETAMARMRGLRAQNPPGLDALPQEVLFAIIDEAPVLTAPERTAVAVGLVATAQSRVAAKASLDDNRAWGYRPELRTHAEGQGDQAETTLVAERTQDIDDRTRREQKDAETAPDLADTAFGGLTDNEQSAFGDKSENVLKSGYTPTPNNSNNRRKIESGRPKFESKHQELVDDRKKTIGDRGDLEKQGVVNQEGPAEKAKVVEEHRVFFESVGFHADAATALNLVQGDKGLARQIIDAIKSHPSTRAIFIGNGIAKQEIGRLVALGAPTLAAMLAHGVTASVQRDFAKSDNRVNALSALFGGAVTGARIVAVAGLFGDLEAAIDGGGTAHLVTLCNAVDPTDVVEIYKATKKNIAVAAAVQPCAANTATLLDVLTLCTTLGWNAGVMQACLAPQGPGAVQAVLRSAVVAHHIARFPKANGLLPWLKAAAQLIAVNACTIAQTEEWTHLPGLPDTWQKSWEISVDGIAIDTYCVHYHPGISTSNGGSRAHFKADRWADSALNVPWAQGPDGVRARSEKQPPGVS